MRKVLETIMITVFTMLTVVINFLVIQFVYEGITQHLSTETIIAIFLIGSTTILLDAVVVLVALDLKEDEEC